MNQDDIIKIILKAVSEAEEKHPEWPKDVIHQSEIVADVSRQFSQACIQYINEGEHPVCIQMATLNMIVTAFRLLKNFNITDYPTKPIP